jgi:hypothetical protein
LHTFAGGPPIQFGKILFVPSLVFEKLVDIFAGADPVLALGDRRKIEIRHLMAKESSVKGPFCKRDAKERLSVTRMGLGQRGPCRKGSGCCHRGCQEISPIDVVGHWYRSQKAWRVSFSTDNTQA